MIRLAMPRRRVLHAFAGLMVGMVALAASAKAYAQTPRVVVLHLVVGQSTRIPAAGIADFPMSANSPVIVRFQGDGPDADFLLEPVRAGTTTPLVVHTDGSTTRYRIELVLTAYTAGTATLRLNYEDGRIEMRDIEIAPRRPSPPTREDTGMMRGSWLSSGRRAWRSKSIRPQSSTVRVGPRPARTSATSPGDASPARGCTSSPMGRGLALALSAITCASPWGNTTASPARSSTNAGRGVRAPSLDGGSSRASALPSTTA